MRLVKIDTQGESQAAIVNPDQIAYLAEGIYGTAIHFSSGEYIVCQGELAAVAEQLFAEGEASDYLIVPAGRAVG
ncbi:MAG: hypothetical protein KGM49_10975 [Sphingomonadales bacterium]|nr:hypothetical protein [Sphingomonadales bacterium]